MAENEIFLVAHLLRRAGFGATRNELEEYAAKGYENSVEELLHPENAPPALPDEDLVKRYHVGQNSLHLFRECQAYWLYRMINTRRPLEEKIALFWHHVFATGYGKLNQPKAILMQIDKFRRYGLGRYDDLLGHLSRDPAMILWLDNKDNHLDGVNENYGRELLELFSMGVGNYTEVDVRQASRAFTGWTMRNASLHAIRAATEIVEPYGRQDWQFEYRRDDHDEGEKSFLGQEGRFNGEDIIEIICRNPATARFLARHLYNFFVADEVQVPAWQTVPPRDPEAIEALSDACFENQYEIRAVLRVLFNSDFFKKSAFAHVKSPAEFVVGTVRLAETHRAPGLDDIKLAFETSDMGQALLDPPSVEGWHTGSEWITTANLVNRTNFAVNEFSSADGPGVRSIIERVKESGPALSPERLVDVCLDLVGPLEVSEETKTQLTIHAAERGPVIFSDGNGADERVREMLQLVVATREYQFA